MTTTRTPARTLAAALLAAALAAGCGTTPDAPVPAAAEAADTEFASMFLTNLSNHCGQAFAGRVVANTPQQDNDPFDGQRLVMHVRECNDHEVKVPFHVGENRSRTWVLTRTNTGLRLKHDHRHEDGTDDAVTMYGGETASVGTPARVEFPVDQESIDLFRREGLTASLENTWAMELEPERRFVYELSRPNGRLLRVEFDLTTPVEEPPAPWGH